MTEWGLDSLGPFPLRMVSSTPSQQDNVTPATIQVCETEPKDRRRCLRAAGQGEPDKFRAKCPVDDDLIRRENKDTQQIGGQWSLENSSSSELSLATPRVALENHSHGPAH